MRRERHSQERSIDALKVHHAHIEDELRVNFAYMDDFKEESPGERNAFSSTLELAVDWTGEFKIGLVINAGWKC